MFLFAAFLAFSVSWIDDPSPPPPIPPAPEVDRVTDFVNLTGLTPSALACAGLAPADVEVLKDALADLESERLAVVTARENLDAAKLAEEAAKAASEAAPGDPAARRAFGLATIARGVANDGVRTAQFALRTALLSRVPSGIAHLLEKLASTDAKVPVEFRAVATDAAAAKALKRAERVAQRAARTGVPAPAGSGNLQDVIRLRQTTEANIPAVTTTLQEPTVQQP